MTVLEVIDSIIADVGKVVLDSLFPVLGLEVKLYRPLPEDHMYSSGTAVRQYEDQPYAQTRMLITGSLMKDHARNHDLDTSSKDSPTTDGEKRAWALEYIDPGVKVVARLVNKELHFRVSRVYQDPTRLGSYYEYILEPL